jgi:hypothetical protein
MGYETSRPPYFLDNQLTDDGEVVRDRCDLHIFFFSSKEYISDTWNTTELTHPV